MARTIKGRLFTRGKRGYYQLQYYLNGKEFRVALRDEEGKTITNQREAEKARDRILAPYIVRDEEQRRQQALDALKNAHERALEADDQANPPLKVSEAWEAYLSAPNRPDSGDLTLMNYKGYCKVFVEWVKQLPENIVYLRDVNTEIAKKFAAHLISSGKSPNTYNKHIFFAALLYRVLKKDIRASENPFSTENITRKKLKPESRRELTIEELYKILNNAPQDLALLLGLGTFTGLRLGDCCTLRWGEIDLARRLIRRIPNKTASRKGEPVLIGIPNQLYSRLIEIPSKNREGYLLPEFAATYLDVNKRSAITHRIKNHFEKCGIQTQKAGTGKFKDKKSGKIINTGKRATVEVGFHSLRHTYISLHAGCGTSQSVVQKSVGHSSARMTLHYTHVDEETARKAATALELPFKTTDNDYKIEQERLKLIEFAQNADIKYVVKALKVFNQAR